MLHGSSQANNTRMLRVDVPTLQGGLRRCADYAERALTNNNIEEIHTYLHEIIKEARNALMIAKHWREDNELRVLQEESNT